MKHVFILFVLLVLAGCGGDDEILADAAPISDGPSLTDATPSATCTCAALGSDFMQSIGTLSSIELPSHNVARDLVPAAISDDPVVRRFGSLLYVINRFGSDNVTVVDPGNWTVIDQFSTGAGSNPQDIAVVGNKAYVAALASPGLQVWDLTDTSAVASTIDLSGFLMGTDDGTTPEPASVFIQGTQAFVTLQHFDSNFMTLGAGTVVVIDTTNDTVTGSFSLMFANPLGFLHSYGTDLVIGTVPDFGNPTASGCLELITTSGTPASGGCIETNASLGGFVGRTAEGQGGALYMIVTRADFTSSVFVARPNTPQFQTHAISPTGQSATDLAYCGALDQLVYAEGPPVGGIRVLDAPNEVEVTDSALDIGLPPVFAEGLICW